MTVSPMFDIRCLAFQATGAPLVDLITERLLGTFSLEHELSGLDEAQRFERFAAFSMIRRHYSRNFDVEDVATGGGNDTGIDAIAIIVNNAMIAEPDTIDELAEQNGYVDPTFIFVQADRGPGFEASKIGNFGFGVKDFFDPNPTSIRNDKVKLSAALTDRVFSFSQILKRPACILYYVTTGKWQDDQALATRRDAVVADLQALSIFESVRFICAGAEDLHSAFTQTKNAVTRSFEFKNRTDLPVAEGINQAFIGYVPFSEFRKIIADGSGEEILGSIFYDNVRDWQEYNAVNQKMRQTLGSPNKDRFVFMNNGVTIIARTINQLGPRFTLADYQVVNGCQTSNVLFDQRNSIDDTVCIPLRLIETRDEAVMDAIIEATNSQTEVKPEQYFARMKFARKLERHFDSVSEDHRIYYERRDGQYDRGQEKKTRVISSTSVIRAFAAMYLEEPHRTTRGYTELRDKVGSDIFGDEHRLEPYYAAAYSYYLLESKFRSRNIAPEYKTARYHILLALRLLIDSAKPAPMNSHVMRHRADELIKALWDEPEHVDALFHQAVAAIDLATENSLERDHVRTLAVRNRLLGQFGREIV